MKRSYWAIPGVKTVPADAENIIRYIEEKTGVPVNGQTRKREVVEARQLAMYIIRKKTRMTTAAIGRKCGGKDHATVLHSIKTIENNLKYNKEFRLLYGGILKKFDINY